MSIYDVAIAGGGPAGAAAAALLARAGLSVAVADAPAPGRMEGLSPRAAAVLDRMGLPAEGVGAALRRRAVWGALDAAPNAERPVDRAAFDAGLRAAAASAGVDVRAARILRVEPGAQEGRLALAGGESLRARLVVEARGRRAPRPAAGLRGPAAVALAGWTRQAGPLAAEVRATPRGWVWRLDAAGADRRWTQIVVDAAALGPGRAGIEAAWAAFFAQPEAGEAEPGPETIRARAAELRLTAPTLDPLAPRIGDAALALDPLSGQGIWLALSAALAAQPVVAALLAGEADLAARFHAQRVAATFLRQARIGRDFHRLAPEFGGAPFWAARRLWPDDAPAHAERRGVTLDRRVIVRDGRLVEAEAALTPQEPEGVAFVAGREIAPILRRIGFAAPPPLAAFHARVLPEAPPEQAALIHGWLTSRLTAGAGAPATMTGETMA